MPRYSRQTCLFPNTSADQDKLFAARILVIGAGGLGATLLPLLVGAGCGSITIMDHDQVEIHNLHRQTLFRAEDIGKNKAETAANRLASLNPDSQLVPIPVAWAPDTRHVVLTMFDLVLDAADSVAATYGLSDRCKAANIAFISASVAERQGHVGGFCKNAPSYRAVFPELPKHVVTCAETGVSGPVVAAIGALQAEMSINYLLSTQPSPIGLLIQFNAVVWKSGSFRFDGAPEPSCGAPPFIGKTDLRASDRVFLLNDLETSLPSLVSSPISVSIETIEDVARAVQAAQRSVFICRRGVTAWKAAARYTARTGDTNVAIVAAG